jgi:choline dehydrogenase-like flavoprotein
VLDPLDPRIVPAHGRTMLRRQFLAGTLACSVGLGLAGGPAEAGENLLCCSGSNPLSAVRGARFEALAAFFEAQLYSLFDGPPRDSSVEVANDALDFVRCLPRGMQSILCNGLAWLNFYSTLHTRQPFAQLSIQERWALLNQGESPPGYYRRRRLSPILWEVDYPLHAAVSTLALLGRLVINSRRPAQNFIGCCWSAPCRDPANLVQMAAPDYPDLSEEYDVCVVGSGAGGAVIAARAAAAGKRVLMIEAGKWVSPDALVERTRDAGGRVQIGPPRSDRVLKELYKHAGVQLSGGVHDLSASRLDLLVESRRRQIKPRQSMIVLQAQVVGGGPYVNNAIHLEIEEEVWNRWPCHPTGVAYADLNERMQEVKQQLGANTIATTRGAGVRGLKFAEGARRAGDEAMVTPVSILQECNGCGADNSVDPFGMHTGGLHPVRKYGPNSYLMCALTASVPAQVAYETSAINFSFQTQAGGEVAVEHLVVEDRRGCAPGNSGVRRVVRAKTYALCAGVSASSSLLHASLNQQGLSANGLGAGLNGNVGVPVFALYDQPVYTGEEDRPEPGITQCFFLREREVCDPDGTVHKEPVLENWFHFPGTVALALCGWFNEFGKTMRKYNHMSIAGMVVPTAVRPENRVQPDGSLDIELSDSEFELLLRGILRIGRIFLAAATPDNGVTLHLPTKSVLLDTRGEPFVIRNEEQLKQGIEAIRGRGAAYLNLLTSHPQGGNALGTVVDPTTFRLLLADGRQVQNLHLADASIFPAGCEVNPQLTIMALAGYAADAMLSGRVVVAAAP